MRISRAPFRPIGILLLVAFGAGACSTLQSALRAPGKVMRGLGPGDPAASQSPDTVGLRLMRFADLSALRITRATEAFAGKAGTPEARIQALEWRIDYTRVFWRLASGPQPFEGVFSSIVVATALRRAHEKHFLPLWGEPERELIDALVYVERDAWTLASEVLEEDNLEEVRATIASWVQQLGDGGATDVNEIPAFGEIIASHSDKKAAAGLLGLITLDPLSGLEPAVAEVEQSRRLAERAFYYLQHLPSLLSDQVELTTLRSARTPELQSALADWERFAAASASIAATANELPESFAAEREALLAQLSLEITAQREGLLADLEAAQEPLNDILRQGQGTAVAGRELSVAATAAFEAGTILSRAIDEMVASLRSGGKTASGDPRPPGRRFDITEYTAAAESVSRGAQALTETISTLDRTLPQLQTLVREAIAQSDRTVDRAFRRALQLLLIALLGGALVTLAVRRITLSWSARQDRTGRG